MGCYAIIWERVRVISSLYISRTTLNHSFDAILSHSTATHLTATLMIINQSLQPIRKPEIVCFYLFDNLYSFLLGDDLLVHQF